MASFSLILRIPSTNQRIEVNKEEKLDEISVKRLKDILFDAAELPQNSHNIVYAGRVLRDSRKVSDYNIKNGVTLFAIKIKGQPKVEEDDPQEPYQPDFAELMQDPRVQAVVHRIMYHRGLMRASIPHMPPGVAALMRSQQGPDQFDAARISSILMSNPYMVRMGQLLMESFMNRQRDGPPPRTRDEFITQLDEAVLEDNTDSDESDSEGDGEDSEGEDELMEQVAESQQQMYEQSQALLAHEHQQRHSSSDSQEPADVQPPDRTSGPRNVITQETLSSVLSSLGQIPSQPAATQQPSSSSQPSSQVRGQPTPAGISPSMLSQALANVLPPTTPAVRPGGAEAGSSTHTTTSTAKTFEEKRQMYRQQLAQLHSMGITHDATCLHALEATNGNVEAALEILMGGK